MADGVISRIALLAALTLAVGACSDDDAPGPVARSSAAPITTSTSTTTTTAPRPNLQSVVDGFVAQQSVKFSVYVVDFTTGERARNLGDREVRSASLYKLFVARELLRRIYAGELSRSAPANARRSPAAGNRSPSTCPPRKS